ncbi:MAG: hypothetical protein RPU42_00165 [Candidatus Sedimenticola sp. (ex Thyasira tokunagai)]
MLNIRQVVFLIAMVSIITFDVNAAEVNRTNLQIIKIASIATNRPEAPSGTQGTIRIYVNSGSWGNTTCRADAADIQMVDNHLLTIIMSAVAYGKTVDISVQSEIRPDGGEVCQATVVLITI